MTVLSVFDGISCAYEALLRAKKPISLYFASETDAAAIKVSKQRHNDTLVDGIVHLGQVEKISSIARFPHLDLLIGGSPCQGFSRIGDGENFEHDGSKLFYEYVKLKNEIKPDYFLLENVVMRREWAAIITEALGVEPIIINSNLVSAQNRERMYWTNIPGVTQPRDLRIFYPNIAEYSIPRLFKKTLDPEKNLNLKDFVGCKDLPRPISFTTRRSEAGKEHRARGYALGLGDTTSWLPHHKEMWPRYDLKVNCITTSPNRDHIVMDEDGDFRRLTVLECERAQTLPDNYTDCGLSDSKRLELIGNGFTVDVIAHILKFIP